MTTVTIGDNTGNTYSGTEDGQLRQLDPNVNYGTATTFAPTKWASGDHTHGIIKFSGLSNITGPVTVSSATLYLKQEHAPSTYSISLYRILRNWVEGQVTWNDWSSGNNWTTGGALDSSDRSTTLTASLSCNTTLEYKGFTSAQLAQDVEDFINGVNSNYGWHVSRTDAGEDSTDKAFWTSDASDGNRPYLEVIYTVPAKGFIMLCEEM